MQLGGRGRSALAPLALRSHAACWPGAHWGMAVWPFQGSRGLLLAALDPWHAGFAHLRPGAGRGRDQGPAAQPRVFGLLARSRGGASAPPLHPSHAQNGKSRAPKAQCGHQKASTALERPHRHAAVPTRPACCMAAQRCVSASTPTTQLQITLCPPPSSKAKVLERPEPWKTRSDRAASSAARLGSASSSSTLSWKPI